MLVPVKLACVDFFCQSINFQLDNISIQLLSYFYM